MKKRRRVMKIKTLKKRIKKKRRKIHNNQIKMGKSHKLKMRINKKKEKSQKDMDLMIMMKKENTFGVKKKKSGIGIIRKTRKLMKEETQFILILSTLCKNEDIKCNQEMICLKHLQLLLFHWEKMEILECIKPKKRLRITIKIGN